MVSPRQNPLIVTCLDSLPQTSSLTSVIAQLLESNDEEQRAAILCEDGTMSLALLDYIFFEGGCLFSTVCNGLAVLDCFYNWLVVEFWQWFGCNCLFLTLVL